MYALRNMVLSAFIAQVVSNSYASEQKKPVASPSPTPIEQLTIFKEKNIMPAKESKDQKSSPTSETKEVKEHTEKANPVVLNIEKTNTIGVKISLPKEIRKPITAKNYTADQLIQAALKLFDEQSDNSQPNEEQEINTFQDAEKYAFTNPFYAFEFCSCIPGIYRKEFVQDMVKEAVQIIKSIPVQAERSFVYTSFASGDLLPDLYFITALSATLNKENIKHKKLHINLVDTDYREYFKIVMPSGKEGGIPWSFEISDKAEKLFEALEISVDEGFITRIENTTHRLTQFLRWATYNLGFNVEIYLYGTAQELTTDYAKKRIPANDLIIAQDYFDIAEGDLAQLLIRTLKIDGIFGSLDNHKRFLPENRKLFVKEEKQYEETSELIQQEKTAWWEQTRDFVTSQEHPDFSNINLIISKKTREFLAPLFKNLLARIRADDRKLGRLFTPLFYTQNEKQAYFEYLQAKKAIGFDVLRYFEIKFSKYIEYSGTEYENEKDLDQQLLHAISNLDKAHIKKLVQQGADLNKNINSFLPLQSAAFVKIAPENIQKKLAVMDLLLTLGANIDAKSTGGWSTLHLLVWHNLYKEVEFLLAKGANPNILDTEQITPLMRAVLANNFKLIPLLIQFGADETLRDGFKQTAADNAKSNHTEKEYKEAISKGRILKSLQKQ